jgi:hypothetical protein
MARMASSQLWLNTTCNPLRDKNIAYGHAMPIGLMPDCKSNIGVLNGVIVFFAQDISVPISRGSPPVSG